MRSTGACRILADLNGLACRFLPLGAPWVRFPGFPLVRIPLASGDDEDALLLAVPCLAWSDFIP